MLNKVLKENSSSKYTKEHGTLQLKLQQWKI